jgi:hypothetical protein
MATGPGQLKEKGTPGGPDFVLSRTEWYLIQTYVIDALALPTTNDAFLKACEDASKTLTPPPTTTMEAPQDLTQFTALLNAYTAIKSHCSEWQTKTYPAIVSLASDIYTYGHNDAPIYYPPILVQAEILEDDPGNEAARKKLLAILKNLQAKAQEHQTKAQDAYQKVQTFASQTAADKAVLGDEKSGLTKTYNDKIGKGGDETTRLVNAIAAKQSELKDHNEEYHRDVVIAATTPTYVFIAPVGTISAIVVAGVYGKRATDMLEQIHADEAKIAELEGQLRTNANILLVLNGAQAGLKAISGALAKALPVIQNVEKIWGSIANNIAAIINLIDTNIAQAPPAIMSLGVGDAVQAWKDVAETANGFRVNAYVVTTTSTASAAA